MMPASSSTWLRLTVCAPASSNSLSAIEAASPAPFSTATVAPSAANFFTVSGIAAQRASPAASFRTAIFIVAILPISLDDQHPDKADDQTEDRAPFEQSREVKIVGDVVSHVLSGRTSEQRLFFGHHLP